MPVAVDMEDISIHALREEGDRETYPAGGGAVYISIHALREEGDQILDFVKFNKIDFYPRPPRGGRPLHVLRMPAVWMLFLSTPSARRATPSHRPGTFRPCISIHALREEGDS